MTAAKQSPVFLGYENKHRDGVPYYPVAKLGDFGATCQTYESDDENPIDLCELGSTPYMVRDI